MSYQLEHTHTKAHNLNDKTKNPSSTLNFNGVVKSYCCHVHRLSHSSYSNNCMNVESPVERYVGYCEDDGDFNGGFPVWLLDIYQTGDESVEWVDE